MKNRLRLAGALGIVAIASAFGLQRVQGDSKPADPAAREPNQNWSQWGGSPSRNNTPVGHDIPTEWNVGQFDYKTGAWDSTEAQNIKWVAKLGSQSYGNPIVHNGKIFVGTNNGGEWLKRFKPGTDLGVVLCFDVKDGKFLWQHSTPKHPAGRVYDWPLQGICSSPYADGERVWVVTNMGEVRCLDTEGFYDGENDGPFASEDPVNSQEADVVWNFDMMKELGISQHNMCACSLTAVGDTLFVCTSNGVDVEHNDSPAPDAPSFVAMDKNTGKVLWTDNSPGLNIHHGQWSSPAYGEFNGQKQVIFGGGDGYVYAFDPAGDGAGKSKLLWKFDANPKDAKLELMGKGTRNDIISTPVIYNGMVYVATGQDPEHGEGVGTLWCINPANKGGDVSKELAYNAADPKTPIAHKRVQAVVKQEGDFTRPNPNSAMVWEYVGQDVDGDGKLSFEEQMHRTISTPAIKDDVLYIPDFSGLLHCLDAKTGKRHWTYDMLSACWGSPMIVEDKVYVGDEDGEVSVFKHSADPSVAMKEQDGEMVPAYAANPMGASVYGTPIVAGNVLYINNQTHLFAISPGGK
ncbi:MAG: PQQ-binding-like beta-propeller repeat protein [Pirellulales bacterium]|nr:PQQ-binding-like beta-propeller repeat protein [Pirellulales bacterium]